VLAQFGQDFTASVDGFFSDSIAIDLIPEPGIISLMILGAITLLGHAPFSRC
jgi:hypothetical protein